MNKEGLPLLCVILFCSSALFAGIFGIITAKETSMIIGSITVGIYLSLWENNINKGNNTFGGKSV